MKPKTVMVFVSLTLLILIFSFIFRSEFLLISSACLMTFSLSLIFILFFVEVYRRRWDVVLFCFLLGLFLFLIFFVVAFSDPDFYAEGLEIPKDIEFKRPIELQSNEEYISLKESVYSGLKFDLVGGYGEYTYLLWYSPPENGNVYLKVYEITHNDRLSEPRLFDRTKIKVTKGESNCISKDFTIYEGEWGQYYGARIEVWFVPDESKNEYKVVKENYVVEGWSR